MVFWREKDRVHLLRANDVDGFKVAEKRNFDNCFLLDWNDPNIVILNLLNILNTK